jgi:rubrerythrin
VEQLERALEFAVRKEKEAEAFYRQWAQRALDPGVRQLLSELASWERGHVEKLSQIKPEELLSQGPPPPDLKLAELLVEVPAGADMTLPEALVLAMKREQASVQLYEGLAALGGPAQKLFSALADEERRHKHLLETEYDDLLTDN